MKPVVFLLGPTATGKTALDVTLTRRLTADEKTIVEPAVTDFLGDVLARARRVTELCLFVQPAQGAPFTIAERLPLRG